ncbi:L-carnitine dehydrogenase [Antarctobacter heliothermus]|uniref:L-carnitine dehydrogenase n=1 Tax=Antarctobacter heliothermus TaxID=74033 RepID=A0A222DXR9_9RHOB|nr:thioesterase family protein [Antarctobacter heliothermus]ASP18755.1 L-carnitine dehydrogenase [Antarctobacter heliothermus]
MLVTETFLHDWTGDTAAPLVLVRNTVKSDWVDEFHHLNMAHYLTICDQANWAFWNWINAPVQTIEARQGHEYAIVENHVTYTGELAEGDAFSIETQLLDVDAKRLVLFHRVMDADGNLSATNEVKFLGFNLNTRRAENWQPQVIDRLAQVLAAHAMLERPVQAGQGITLQKRSST